MQPGAPLCFDTCRLSAVEPAPDRDCTYSIPPQADLRHTILRCVRASLLSQHRESRRKQPWRRYNSMRAECPDVHVGAATAHHSTTHLVYPDPLILSHVVLREVGGRINMGSRVGLHLEETHVIPATS